MLIKEMENNNDLLGDIRALYLSRGSRKMCGLARMCQALLTAVEEETDAWNKYPEVRTVILEYIIQMYQILHEEKNNTVRKMGYDILSKLSI